MKNKDYFFAGAIILIIILIAIDIYQNSQIQNHLDSIELNLRAFLSS